MELKIFISIVYCIGLSASWPVEIRVKNNAQFAADFSKLLYKQNKEENFVFSPVSLEMLFAMLWEGADGNTDQQIKKLIFHCEDSDLNCVRLYVSSLRNASQEYNTDETTLKFSSILAMDHRTPITFGFREALQSFPSAEFVKEDFARHGDRAVNKINGMVAKATEQRIENLIPLGSVDADTAMVLVNALYLKASFLQPFSDTEKGTFFESSTQSHIVEFLRGQFQNIAYHKNGLFSMIELPFKAEKFSLYIAMQESNHKIDVGDVINRKFAGQLEFDETFVDVKMPKFTMKYTVGDMIDQVKLLNVTDIFDVSKADFSGLLQYPWDKVVVSDMHHKAFFEVTEAGIEAAASTAALATARSWMSPDLDFHVDRPFAFFVTMKHGRALEFESVVFAGQYNKPPII